MTLILQKKLSFQDLALHLRSLRMVDDNYGHRIIDYTILY